MFFCMSPWICSSHHTRCLPCHLRIFSPFCGQMHPRCSFLCRLCSKLLQSDRQSCQLPTRNLQRKTEQTINVCRWLQRLLLQFMDMSYRSGRCRSKKTFSHSSSSQSPPWLTHTAPVSAHGTASGCTTAASWSLARSSLSSVTPEGQ